MAVSTCAPVVDIVIPVYNEQAVLAQSVATLRDYLQQQFPFSWRITIADNASTDRTWALATDLAATMTGVHALHLDQKGRGRALRAAWTDNDAAIVAYMDVDLSTGLDALLPLIAPLVTGHSDVAIGSRLIAGSKVARGPQREFISRSYNRILRTVFSNSFHDAQCGFKAVRSDVAAKLLPLVHDNEWFFDTELLLLAERNGLRVLEVPVTWIDDPDSRVHITSTAKKDLQGVARLANDFLHRRGIVDMGEAARPALADDFGRSMVARAETTAALIATAVATLGLLRSSRPASARPSLHGWRGGLAGRARA